MARTRGWGIAGLAKAARSERAEARGALRVEATDTAGLAKAIRSHRVRRIAISATLQFNLRWLRSEK